MKCFIYQEEEAKSTLNVIWSQCNIRASVRQLSKTGLIFSLFLLPVNEQAAEFQMRGSLSVVFFGKSKKHDIGILSA